MYLSGTAQELFSQCEGYYANKATATTYSLCHAQVKMAIGKRVRKVVFLFLFFIYVLTDLNLQVYCKGSQSGKDVESHKNDDFSEFDQEDESEPVEDDNEFGYVTTPDQETGQGEIDIGEKCLN